MTNLTLFQDFLNRSVGWDHLLDTVACSSNRTNFPPYDIIKNTDENTEIQLALAGYSRKDISVKFQDRILTISSGGVDKRDDVQYNYNGVAKRRFITKFSLGQYHEVQDASMKDGMLIIEVVKVVPEDQKVKIVTIN
jgi:molecular chaperone IbpA